MTKKIMKPLGQFITLKYDTCVVGPLSKLKFTVDAVHFRALFISDR